MEKAKTPRKDLIDSDGVPVAKTVKPNQIRATVIKEKRAAGLPRCPMVHLYRRLSLVGKGCLGQAVGIAGSRRDRTVGFGADDAIIAGAVGFGSGHV